ncbi:P63C domain-containing protein [Gordonia sputi]
MTDKEFPSRGGRARASKLAASERSRIAREAANARWNAGTPLAPHVGELVIGDTKLSCAVLENGTRLINQATLLAALGRSRSAKSDQGVKVLFAANLRPFMSPELQASLGSPVPYRIRGGGRALGYPAELLPQVCDVYLDARNEGILLKNQEPAAFAAEILMRGLARVGIVALVDEATGYQETRAKNELAQILKAYVAEELQPWMKRFPDEFFKQIYRLQGWEFKEGNSKRPSYVGNLINKYIYEQLPEGVLEELQRLNPTNDKGHRSHKHHQHLTEGTGNVHLDRQIATVTTMMRASRSKAEFDDWFDRAYPGNQPQLPLVVEVGGD